MTGKIRIKDIAERAGVSVGTVDRVLHNRPNVSTAALQRVQQALEDMNYQPNAYASALAYNKSYNFILLIPKHEAEAYWDEIEEGALHAMEVRRDFHIAVEIMFYERLDEESFSDSAKACLNKKPDGIVVVPSSLNATRTFTDCLHEQKIPFVLLDAYMPDLKPLTFYGQDSFVSGYFAAKMLMLIANQEKEVAIMKCTKNGVVISNQQSNREVGFRHYMQDHYPEVKIIDMELPAIQRKRDNDKILNDFFSAHPLIHHCITFSSLAHVVGDYLLRFNRREIQIMGYDVIDKNVECLNRGSISFLIAQHAFLQGFNCIDSLFQAIVLKKEVAPVNYMPIELLTKENVIFYRRTQH